MRFVLALAATLMATPAAAEWVATKISVLPGDNARNVDTIARYIEEPVPLIPCPGVTPPFALPMNCDELPDDPPEEIGATAPPEGGLPDGQVAFGPDWGDINAAWYDGPTERYAHGALGDIIEATTLRVETADGTRLSVTLDNDEVFEDRTPRIVDFDGFGKFTIVTIVSHQQTGARVTVFQPDDDELKRVAQTPPIGTSNRWLNIAGFADFDGAGSGMIALVDRPHLAGNLQFWRWSKGELTLRAEAAGFSNHINGSREQRLAAVEDFDDDGVSDLAIPSRDRRELRFVKFPDRNATAFETLASVSFPAMIDKPISVFRDGSEIVLTVGTADGAVYAVHRK